jgi:predicted GNAT family N-acyltransferase
MAKRDGRDCYLVATPAGRPLYKKAGFVDLGELSIFGVPHYPMILKNDCSRPN